MSDNWAIITSAVIGIVSFVASHQFAAWRDRESKRREQRINYLITTFRALAKSANNPDFHQFSDSLEQAIADIQLFGSVDQIQLAQEFAKEFANNQSASPDPLLKSLWNDLRKEMGQKEYKGKYIWFRLTLK
jgi:hypothetical protein